MLKKAVSPLACPVVSESSCRCDFMLLMMSLVPLHILGAFTTLSTITAGRVFL